MYNSNYNTQPININNNNKDNNKEPEKKTITIDTKYKEIYYRSAEPLKESPQALQHQHIFWNYMMHVSMQNTISQMVKV